MAILILFFLLVSNLFAQDLPWLRVEKGEIKNNKGERIILRGPGGNPFWHGFTSEDEYLDQILRYGLNSFRYSLNFDSQSTWENFDRLLPQIDKIVEKCKERKLYVILDAHFEPGWQPEHWTPWKPLADFFEDKELQRRWLEIWGKLSARYANESTVAMYELINEPFYSKGKRIRKLVQKCVKLIRKNDAKHIIAVPQNNACFWMKSTGKLDVWSKGPLKDHNCCYVVHAYGWPSYGEESFYGADAQFKAAKRWAEKYRTCLWFSEFGPRNVEGFTDKINGIFLNRLIDNLNTSGYSAHLWWWRENPPQWMEKIIQKLAKAEKVR